jgi:hypothetical protein
MADEQEQGFLSRWSRRKREIAEGGEGEAKPVDDAAQAELRTGATDAPAEEQVPIGTEEERANREAAEAIEIESLNYESDFSVFLKIGVPELLRKQAMRKLWSSSPVLANLDGLNDYDEDFANPALNVFRSNWQVGRGFLSEEDRKPKSERVAEIKEPAEDDLTLPDTTKGSEAKDEMVETTALETMPDANVSSTSFEETVEPDKAEIDAISNAGDEGPQQVKRVSLRQRLLEE